MKKTGFTLIELLAVIVILAIIVLIATPTILGVIEKAKKGAFKDSVYGLIDATSIYMAENIEEGDLKFICDGTYCQLENGDKLSFKGEIPKSGAIKVDENQRISVEYISNGKYCAYGTMDNLVIDKDCEQLDTTEKANYTVNHYQMNVSGSGYTLKETEILKGSLGYSETPNTKTYVGFTSPSKQTVTVSEDGTTTVNYYYTRNKYTVVLNKGTGIYSVGGAGTYYYGDSVNLEANPITGYHFTSWSGTYNTGSFTMPAGNVTMTANGAANTYYIVYNGNGADSGGMGITTCIYGQNCTLAGLGYGKTGHSFSRWSGSNGGSYSNGQIVSNLTTTNGATITMNAVWKVNQYTVTVNRGTGIASVSGAETYYYGAAVNLGYSLTAGYHFSSWSGTYNTGSFTMPAGNVTITANGAGNVYYIAYNGNGATSGSMGTTTCTYGQNCTLAGLGFAKPGYHLNNWNGSNGGSYSNGQTVSNLTTTNGATITMSANWAYNNGTAVYYNPVTNSKCNQGEAVSTTETKTGENRETLPPEEDSAEMPSGPMEAFDGAAQDGFRVDVSGMLDKPEND